MRPAVIGMVFADAPQSLWKRLLRRPPEPGRLLGLLFDPLSPFPPGSIIRSVATGENFLVSKQPRLGDGWTSIEARGLGVIAPSPIRMHDEFMVIAADVPLSVG